MKTVRVTIEINESFLKLLGANVRLGNIREKVSENNADPSQMLGLVIFAEAKGGHEEEIYLMLPPERRDEIKVIHEDRKVFDDGVQIHPVKAG
jgi:hypothetical protein